MKAKAAADSNSYANRDRGGGGIGERGGYGGNGGGYGADRGGGGVMVSNIDTSRGNRNPNQYESIVTRSLLNFYFTCLINIFVEIFLRIEKLLKQSRQELNNMKEVEILEE